MIIKGFPWNWNKKIFILNIKKIPRISNKNLYNPFNFYFKKKKFQEIPRKFGLNVSATARFQTEIAGNIFPRYQYQKSP